MRKLIRWLALVMLIAGAVACEMPWDNPFVGTWDYQGLLTLTFTGASSSIPLGVWLHNGYTYEGFSGTYYYTDDYLTIDWDDGPVEVIEYLFLGDDVMKLTFVDGATIVFIRE